MYKLELFVRRSGANIDKVVNNKICFVFFRNYVCVFIDVEIISVFLI